jgi:restriction system protein
MWNNLITEQPRNWRELQNKVDWIFNCVGLSSQKVFKVDTPRGKIELDVYAIDPSSVDQIRYVVECKNWNNRIPQTVVHSFTTVMQETGANIGYIISKKGFQKGAIDYTKSTNIRLWTFNEFQNRYFEIWYRNHFALVVFNLNTSLIHFTEPINTRRFKYQDNFNETQNKRFAELLKKYSDFVSLLSVIGSSNITRIKLKSSSQSAIISLETINNTIEKCFQIQCHFQCYDQALEQIKILINKTEQEFIELFGSNIFIE